MKIKIDEQYVRCRFCDSSWFIYTLKDSNNIYKETPKMLQYNCPACGHVQTSRKFNTDEEDLPDNLKEKSDKDLKSLEEDRKERVGKMIRDNGWMYKNDPVKGLKVEREYDKEGLVIAPCPKGGNHEWRTDGQHSNKFCGKCYESYMTELSPTVGEAIELLKENVELATSYISIGCDCARCEILRQILTTKDGGRIVKE